MNKKLLSLAIAAATAAPTAVLADATLYGKAHVSIDYTDQYYTSGNSTVRHTGWGLSRGQRNAGSGNFSGRGNERASRIGVRGSEDLGSGLKAIYQIEFGVPLANENDYDLNNGEQGTIKMRNSYVGLQGDFGTFLIGRHDTPLKISTSKLDLFNDRMADYAGTLGFNDVRADNTITYISPDFAGGFQFAAAIIPGGTSQLSSDTQNLEADGLAEGYSLAAIYKNGPWYGSVAYETQAKELSGTSNDPNEEDFETLRLGAGIRDWNGLYLTGLYEKQESVGFTKNNDADLWQIQAGYKFGNTMVKGMYGQYDLDPNSGVRDNLDRDSWAIGIDHSFTKRTTLYALYTEVDTDNNADKNLNDWSGFSLGVIHDF
ncbi:MAG: porin [Candidatus Thiosymbion ectosymbiont of Robbea hypermnestra]|nr:porin [Candidatus Thiosymbion ectosymbiont of Robbea hypermnestra]